MFRLTLVLAFIVVTGTRSHCAEPARDATGIDFARDVFPVLQRACFECHGPAKQLGGLRLDSRQSVLAGGDSGPAITPGHPDKSELVRRISLARTDPEVMPNRGEVLTPSDVAHIRKWIAAGAVWPEGLTPPPHWAYVAPVRPRLPDQAIHPVDALVRLRLPREWPSLSPRAELATIARRLHFDLIGLPPSPAAVDAFVAAAERDLPAAVETAAAELLASPQFGEKWARPWLDAARYADSHGFQRDDLRDVWPYRDWVIRALNQDMPFDQFTIEQLAGDLLPNPTEAQRIATGFNRCAPCNVEAGTDPEENRVNQVFDRVNTLGAVWLGTTLECCQCHDHKYDPFTLRDYYGLFAIFNQTRLEAERSNPKVPGSIKFVGPYLLLSDPERDAQRQRITKEIAAVKSALADPKPAERASPGKNKAGPIQPSSKYALHVLKPDDFESAGGADHKILDDGSVLLLGDPPEKDTYTVTVRTSLQGIVGFRLDALTDPSLPGMGPGRGDPERTNFIVHEFTVSATAAAGTAAQPVSLADAQADFSQQKWDVGGAIDGDLKTGWAIAPRFHQPHWALFRAAENLPAGDGTLLTFKVVQNFGSARTLGRLKISAITGEYPGSATAPAADDPSQAKLREQLAELETSLGELAPQRTLVMQEVDQPRPSRVLQRGDFRSPGAPAEPATPAVLPGLAAESRKPLNRLDLARWLVRRDNPLVARVTVNRFWAEIFGEGLVSTPEDFGIKGDRPSHPELLDWLAVEFMENGWSTKRLLHTIVTSETYRQSSRIPARLLDLDPHNRWLARGPRIRLSAEAIRDNALAIAGLISLEQFGPPIRPPQPDGLWAKVGGEKYDYVVSPGEEQHRRGVYVVLKRMSPYPSFISFDATARLACRVKRVRSNTPLQALVLLNDPVYVEAARVLGERVRRDVVSTDVADRLRYAFRLAVARAPRAAELAVLRQLYDAELAISGGRDEQAWFAIASALLNLDETITRN